MILLDNDSTVTVFCNPKYIPNKRDSDDIFSINTNVWILKYHHKCNIPYINNIWYKKIPSTNIISMKYTTETFCIKMDQKEELELLVHMLNNIVKFKQISNGLYAMYPNDNNIFVFTKIEYHFMNHLEDNLKCLRPRHQN